MTSQLWRKPSSRAPRRLDGTRTLFCFPLFVQVSRLSMGLHHLPSHVSYPPLVLPPHGGYYHHVPQSYVPQPHVTQPSATYDFRIHVPEITGTVSNSRRPYSAAVPVYSPYSASAPPQYVSTLYQPAYTPTYQPGYEYPSTAVAATAHGVGRDPRFISPELMGIVGLKFMWLKSLFGYDDSA